MYFDLSVSLPEPALLTAVPNQNKKAKGKQQQGPPQATVSSLQCMFNAPQINALEARIDLLVHLGYSIFAFNQVARTKIDPKNHVNILDGLFERLKKRPGVVYLKRLTIVLDEDSEKGFGLTNSNSSLFTSYDLLAVVPTTATTFSLACLTHTLPSTLTTHIISLPLTLPRLPFHLKHTLVRTALKNGAVFEINYAGVLGEAGDGVDIEGEGGSAAKRNWWAGGRELVRVTKGKGIIVSGGVRIDANLRAPRDIGNLISLLGLPQDAAHAASTSLCKSLVLRAQTRRTYRAILSGPVVVFPVDANAQVGELPLATSMSTDMVEKEDIQTAGATVTSTPSGTTGKRPLEDDQSLADNQSSKSIEGDNKGIETASGLGSETGGKKKKRKKNKIDTN